MNKPYDKPGDIWKDTHNTEHKSWREEFDKEFTYAVLYSASSDLSSGEGKAWRFPDIDPNKVKDFIAQVEQDAVRRTNEEWVEMLKKHPIALNQLKGELSLQALINNK